MSVVMAKISREPALHVLKTCPLNSVNCVINLTICGDQIRGVERIALVNGLRGCVGLVEAIRRNSYPSPGVAWGYIQHGTREKRTSLIHTKAVGQEQPVHAEVPSFVHAVHLRDRRRGGRRELFGEHVHTLSLVTMIRRCLRRYKEPHH